eukprot:Phypoly_transcript_01799.p1 GENE.Phypoly_transcript_01799~~Phypoly_transcript_01799.p1  ORF type:complete len:509 (+),score=43.80 Phypoly_transcript_01799:1579-3105(+)
MPHGNFSSPIVDLIGVFAANVCGNRQCEQDENCYSCDLDCGACSCTPPCQHEGICVGINICNCIKGYHNATCQTPICTNGCPPNATCVAPDKCQIPPTSPPIPPPTTAPTSCAIKNGGCDYSVQCIVNADGVVACEPCQNGTLLNTTTNTCISYCGNVACEAIYGENCVTCPADCGITGGCGICGDSFCDTTESCGTCWEDCGVCERPKCPSDCNSHGTCVNGQCACVLPWTGPSCSSVNKPLIPHFHPTHPNVTVQTTSSSMEFFISIQALSELDQSGNAVRTEQVHNYNFTLNQNTNETYTLYNYSALLENGASLDIIVWIFNASTPIDFAGNTTVYAQNTIKINVIVQSWPFYALANSLAVIFNSTKSEQKNCAKDFVDDSGNLRWVAVSLGDLSLYGQFDDKSIIDGRVRSTSYVLNSDYSVSAILPHFWDFAEMDPSYSLLVADQTTRGCGSSNTKWKLAVEIAVPCVAGAVLITLFVLVGFRKISLCAKLHTSFREIQMKEH